MHLVYAGAYNRSLNLTGNLSESGAYVAVNETVQVGYAAYTVLAVAAPTPTTRSVELRAAEARELEIAAAARGEFPVAGTYAANSPVPLTPRTLGVSAREVFVSEYAAFLNLTLGANGSVGLANEQLRAYEGVNLSFVASEWPNVTALPNGSTSISYTSGAITETGYLIAEFNATFTPALTLIEEPLALGERWNATSQVQVVGGEAFASEVVASAGGAEYTQSRSWAASLNASAPIALSFEVTNTTTLRFPDGSTATGYVVSASMGNGSQQYTLWDGMLLLPGGGSDSPSGAQAQVAAPSVAAPAQKRTPTDTSAVVDPSRGLPVAAEARPTGGEAVTAAPMSPAQAEQGIHGVGVPTVPSAPPPVDLAGALLVFGLITLAAGSALGFILGSRRRTRHP
jgi:hypothetical protein